MNRQSILWADQYMKISRLTEAELALFDADLAIDVLLRRKTFSLGMMGGCIAVLNSTIFYLLLFQKSEYCVDVLRPQSMLRPYQTVALTDEVEPY